ASADLVDYFRNWGSTDARSLWLAGVLLCMDVPSRLVSTELMPFALDLIEFALTRPSSEIYRKDAFFNRATATSAPGSFVADKSHDLLGLDETEQLPFAGETSKLASSATSENPSHQRVACGAQQPSAHPSELPRTPGPEISELGRSIKLAHWLPTERAGLLFIVQLMKRLGFAEWLRAHSDAIERQLPVRVLRAVTMRLDTPNSDPVMRVLEIEDSELARGSASEIQSYVQHWLRSIRRWCRIQTKIGLFDLVCRRGWIAVTPTHLDIRFQLQQSD